MDKKLKYTIDFARDELDEIEQYHAEGKLTDKGVFIRLFQLGKTMIGWDDDVPVSEAMEKFLQANNTVTELLNAARKAKAS